MIEYDILEQCLKDWKKLNKILNERGNNDEATYDIIHNEIKLLNSYLIPLKKANKGFPNPDGTTFFPAVINVKKTATILSKLAKQSQERIKQAHKRQHGKQGL